MPNPPGVHSSAIATAGQPLSSEPSYVQVVVPVHVSQAFTYRLPEEMRSVARPGARLLVPLGGQLVTGYIVSLDDELHLESPSREKEIKEAVELLDESPLVTPEVFEITRWIAEYYGTPWGEVIRAALPPGITATIERVVSLTPEGHRQLPALLASAPIRGSVLKLINEHSEIAIDRLARDLGKLRVNRAIRELDQEGLIDTIQRARKPFNKPKYQRAVRLSNSFDGNLAGQKLSGAQYEVIQRLKDHKTLFAKDLKASQSAVKALQRKGIVELFDAPIRRDPLAASDLPTAQEFILTAAQADVLNKIEAPLREGLYKAFLLHGVTGSGKTEVYMRAMRTALELDRSAMMLVPEIALTPVFSRRLRANFGDRVAIFHSSLSKGERLDEWTRVRNGEARIVIGTRSGVFAPTTRLGLVIVDEEHEPSYRQHESPIYHGRDTAIVRGQKESAVVILGSATPSLESFHNIQTGKYEHLELPERIANRPFASSQIIDMRRVFAQYGKPKVFSDELLEAIEETYRRKEQSIILLNRRGYSSAVLCRACGEMVQCPNCDVTLTYHRGQQVILCHYCNHSQPAPARCPECGAEHIYYIGEGTEQIEEMLRAQFPALRIARIDRDTTSRRRKFETTLLEFGAGNIDMLVGTQMLAKGHDFPNVTLVGVVSVDAGLVLPDFRAAEKTFQLITQVAGRAGRGTQPGHVLIQTYHPQHYAIRHASAQDYAGFYEEEVRHRKHHAYPPFVVLALFLVHGEELVRLRKDANALRKALNEANRDRLCRVLGPAPAPLARLKSEHRIQLLVKGRNRKQLRQVIDDALKGISKLAVNRRSINLEIDPVSVL